MYSDISQKRNWYAIYTKSRFEKKIFTSLSRSGIPAFLPLIKQKRQWHDRVKIIESPLLPSYVFVYISSRDFANVYPHTGFVKFVAFQGKPAIIQEKEIELLRQIITYGRNITPYANCRIGDCVKITSGPFKGWNGKVERQLGNHRISFRLPSIQQAISIEVDMGEVEVTKREVLG